MLRRNEMALKFKVPLKERKDGAVYKAKIAVQYQDLGNGVTLAKPDLSMPIVEIEANSEGLAYKKLCETFKPDDKRRVDGKGFINMCQVGASGRIYKKCEKHKRPYYHLENQPDSGCEECGYEKMDAEMKTEHQKLLDDTALVLGCSSEQVEENGWFLCKDGGVGCLTCGVEVATSRDKLSGRKFCGKCRTKLGGT
jgi:hypothetical protein